MTNRLPPPNNTTANGIDEDEAALYDRQIRLWGVEAQNKMRSSSVLLATLKGISTEVAKNIVLAGIGSLSILDHEVVQERDLGANFFLREEDVGSLRVEAAAPRIQALNPRVKINTFSDSDLLDSEEFLAQFDVIVVTEVSAVDLEKINTLTRKLNKKLFAASSIAVHGWIFADLLEHEYVVDIIKNPAPGETLKVPTKLLNSYVPFSKFLDHKWSSSTPADVRGLKRLMKNLWWTLTIFQTQILHPTSNPITPSQLLSTSTPFLISISLPPSLHPSPEIYPTLPPLLSLEFPPTTAVLGGILAQDVLNTLGEKEEPIKNFFLFDGNVGGGGVFGVGF